MAKSIEIKSKVLEFRSKGFSIKELAKKFNISKSTVSVWTRNIALDQTAKNRLLTRVKSGQLIASERKKIRNDLADERLLNLARNKLNRFKLSSEAAQLFCAMIYWCEGAKDPNCVKFVNSDPDLVKLFVDLLEKYYDVPRHKLKVLMRLHEYHDQEKQKKFWSQKLSISSVQFHKSYLKPHTGKRVRENYPGCISICRYDTILAKKLLFLAKSLLNKA